MLYVVSDDDIRIFPFELLTVIRLCYLGYVLFVQTVAFSKIQMAANAISFLKEYSLSNFPAPSKIITVSEADSIISALRTLSSNDILCAPVLSEDGTYVESFTVVLLKLTIYYYHRPKVDPIHL